MFSETICAALTDVRCLTRTGALSNINLYLNVGKRSEMATFFEEVLDIANKRLKNSKLRSTLDEIRRIIATLEAEE
jgi:hypothetical protein